MITISIELLSSFSLSDICDVITAFCEIITLLILIIRNKKKALYDPPNPISAYLSTVSLKRDNA
jgi:hypothetical protein